MPEGTIADWDRVNEAIVAVMRIRDRRSSPRTCSAIRGSVHFDLENSCRERELRGTSVARLPDRDFAVMDAISRKYTGQPFPFRANPDGRGVPSSGSIGHATGSCRSAAPPAELRSGRDGIVERARSLGEPILTSQLLSDLRSRRRPWSPGA